MSQYSETRLLYRQDQFPIFQNRTYDTEEEAKACLKGDIELVEDQRTGLVYNAAFRAELMQYDKDYQNEQALSPSFRVHLDSVSELIDRYLGRAAIVEVGCGKGFFLESLQQKGFEITGFDPTYEGNNPRVLRRYFAPGVGIQAKGLILRHVLEHVQDPISFLRLLQTANGGGGRIYIEVPCFDWICEHRAWFDVFYEHVNYFRLSDFHRIFGGIVDSGRLFGDQYLYVIAELDSLRQPNLDTSDRVIFPHDFTQNITEPNRTEPNRTAIWGGASKGVIFSLLKQRAGYPITTVIDINPAKIDRFLPATGLCVCSPEEGMATLEKGATIYVMNSMYLDEIRAMSNNDFHYIGVDHG